MKCVALCQSILAEILSDVSDVIYIYIFVQYPRLHTDLSCSRFMWVSQVLSAFSLVRDLSWSFACPVYCGGSQVPFLFLGFGSGLVCGFLLVFCALRAFGLRIIPDPGLQFPVDLSPRPLRRAHRLSGYLHE